MSNKPEGYLPLYEAKMMHQFTHRWATYQPDGKTRDMTLDELRDPHCVPQPRYWVDEREVEGKLKRWERDWLVAIRRMTNSTNERTAIVGVLPRVAVADTATLMHIDADANLVSAIIANYNAMVFDYSVRRKIGGTVLTHHYLKQLPVIPPHTY